MEVKDLIAKKALLERGIVNLITDFQEETGVNIDAISVSMAQIGNLGTPDKWIIVGIKISLAL